MAESNRPKDVLHQAQEAEKTGQSKEASNLYATLASHLRRHEKWKEAMTMIGKAIELSKSSARLYLQKARIEVGLNDYSSAKTSISLFLQFSIQKKRVSQYSVYLEEQLKDYPVLRQKYYEELLSIDRTEPSAFLGLYRSYRQQSKLKESQNILLEALKIKGAEDRVLKELNEVLKERKLEESAQLLKKYQDRKISYDDLVSLLSEEKSKGIKNENSEMMDGKTIEKGLGTLIAELEMELGVSLEEKRDTVEPLIKEFMKRSEAIIAGDSKARTDMALAFFEMGLSKHAKEELRPIQFADPLFLESQCLLGEILISEGSDLRAMEVFQQCLRDERATAAIKRQCWYHLILIYQRLGDLEQASNIAKVLEKNSHDYRDIRQLRLQILTDLKIRREK